MIASRAYSQQDVDRGCTGDIPGSELKTQATGGSNVEQHQDAAVPVTHEVRKGCTEESAAAMEEPPAAAGDVKMDVDEGCTEHILVSELNTKVDESSIMEKQAGAGPVTHGRGMEIAVDGAMAAVEPAGALPTAEENGASGMKVSCGKRKLDQLVSPGAAIEVNGPPSTRQRVDVSHDNSARSDASQKTGSGSDISRDADSSSNSSDFTKELPAELCPPVQGPELPPSSADIDVPEESIVHLFSVYNYLRSFSVQLFLSPFGLDDFVACVNCTVQTTLLDAVHVSLLRALRRHLETKSSEGSQLASNCLSYLDWTLLDALTWTNLLLEYLYVMSCIKNLGGQSFARNFLTVEYYKLPVTMKLSVLQILCDHVIESEEFKAELEAREGYNEEIEYGSDPSIFSEAGSRAVLTRASKTSVCKRKEDLLTMEAAPNATNSEDAIANASRDGNSDDCRICGMDGKLVCCDGCPWAYHSRCIGLNKAFLPQGLWFCPECVVNKLGPASSRRERGARGAQMFGIDMCGRLFLGSCNYLLVMGTSMNAESCARYYNQYDVVKVLQTLAVSDAYTDICRRMTEYWSHFLDVIKEVGARHTPQSNKLLNITRMKSEGNVQTILKGGGDGKTVVLSQIIVQHGTVSNQLTDCSAEQKCMMTNVCVASEKNNEVRRQIPLTQNCVQNTPINGAFGSSGVSSISHQYGCAVTALSNITRAQPAHGLIRPDPSACSSEIDNGMSREDIGSTIHVKANTFCLSYQSKRSVQLTAENFGNMSGGKPAKVSSFKPQAYMNLYNHGNIAASAAANVAALASDEGRVSASQLATNVKKQMVADCALQVKAFSSPTAQFIWPSTEKKVMEVPRDKCGWCLSCKSSASGAKKACFLNTATANAAKGSARILSSMHVVKSSESHFPSIVSYLVNMEESLRGLLAGTLQDMLQRQRWHKKLHKASNCRTIVPLLLELESNIRGIAFYASWSKLIDEWLVGSPSVSAAASRPAAYQKRGTGGRRGRKRSFPTESGTLSVTDDDKTWKKVKWWSGGNISKRILQRGALPCSSIRKAARQGGKERMAGLSYHEGSNFPRRTRQFSWRACVGLCQNSSQLALQVRYLDAHIRWREFIPPDQIPSDGRASDADFSAFRNAVVCDRKVVDNKITYALKFRNQKHLPVRVTKNILEAEGNKDVNGKVWFSENHVPLCFVREFEKKAGASSLPYPGMLLSNCFVNLYQRRVKASIGDVFSYLFHKGDVYPCASCKKDVPFSSCQGKCHKDCTLRSVGNEGGNVASSLICKLCLQKRNLVLTNYKTNARYALPQQKSNCQLTHTATKVVFKVGSSHSAESAAMVQARPVAKVQAQPVAKVEVHPKIVFKFGSSHSTESAAKVQAPLVAKVPAQPIAKVEVHTVAKVKSQPTAKMEAQSMTKVGNEQTNVLTQAQPKTKTKKPKPAKPRKPKKIQEITYFGLVWKKDKSDNRGSDFRANDVILKSKFGIGSSIKPTCCLCGKPYSPDSLYVRCEQCKGWFHGDALRLEEEEILDLVAYQCCKCRKRAIPRCPHSDDYKMSEPEFSEQTVATSSQSTVFSSEETFAAVDQDPLLASYGVVEPIGQETSDADLSMNMLSFAPGPNQKLSIRRPQAHNCGNLDLAGTPVNEHMQNQPLGNANTMFNHMGRFSLSEADSVHASELLGWDFSQGNAYASPPDYTNNSQWNDTSCGSFATNDYEPQSLFSFTDLLEGDDRQLDNTFGMPTGLQDDDNCTGSFDQVASFNELDFMVEDGSSNMHFPENDPSSDVVCKKCNNPQPPPDLKCLLCGMHIHRDCSPWDGSDQAVDNSSWSCGACREWR